MAYEGAVAVSIPIIKALREGLVANRIEWVAGIINGTSNFILSQMRLEGVSFADALADAQQRGFAELDPRFDVEGIDAAHKLTLLASNAFGIHPQFAQVHVEGIAQLESVDFDYAQALGYSIKLLGIGKRLTQGVERQALELRVHPTLIAADHLLAHVNDSMNAVMVKSDAAGVTMVYGAGAGSEETASAVIADLVDIARVKDLAHHHRVPYLGFQAKQMRDVPIIPIEDVQTQHYLRINTHKAFETLALVQGCFAKLGMEIQEEKVFATLGVPAQEAIVFIVKHCKDKRVASLTKQIERLPNVVGRVTHIRVEALE